MVAQERASQTICTLVAVPRDDKQSLVIFKSGIKTVKQQTRSAKEIISIQVPEQIKTAPNNRRRWAVPYPWSISSFPRGNILTRFSRGDCVLQATSVHWFLPDQQSSEPVIRQTAPKSVGVHRCASKPNYIKSERLRSQPYSYLLYDEFFAMCR